MNHAYDPYFKTAAPMPCTPTCEAQNRRLLAVTGEPDDDGAQVILEAIELGHVVDDGESEDG